MRVRLKIKGGRVGGPQTRGQDVVVCLEADGRDIPIPGVISLVLRVQDRRAVATMDVVVEDVDLVGLLIDEVTRGLSG